EMILQAKKMGIETGTFIMLGYPGETESDIKLTLNYLKSANPDDFTITVAYPIKGTPLYTETEASQIKVSTWASTTDHDIDFKRSYHRSYYFFAIRWVVNGVKLHKLHLTNGAYGMTGWKSRLKIIVARLGMFLTKSKMLKIS
ncbi:MAG: B12-binding domain-containing radical SAM protein, partial [Saprospiraceae bacterium]|nr:B12-binding domain-containing radical SAM protein [Saprospiraceae bacterium]